jgi:hypothetical protein
MCPLCLFQYYRWWCSAVVQAVCVQLDACPKVHSFSLPGPWGGWGITVHLDWPAIVLMLVIVTSYGRPCQCNCVHFLWLVPAYLDKELAQLFRCSLSLSTQCGRLCDFKTKVHVGLKYAAGALTGVVANVQPAVCLLLLYVTGEKEHWWRGGQHREVHHLPVRVWRQWGCAVSASRVSHCLSVCPVFPQYKYFGLFLVLLQFNPVLTDILHLGGNLLASWA